MGGRSLQYYCITFFAIGEGFEILILTPIKVIIWNIYSAYTLFKKKLDLLFSLFAVRPFSIITIPKRK